MDIISRLISDDNVRYVIAKYLSFIDDDKGEIEENINEEKLRRVAQGLLQKIERAKTEAINWRDFLQRVGFVGLLLALHTYTPQELADRFNLAPQQVEVLQEIQEGQAGAYEKLLDMVELSPQEVRNNVTSEEDVEEIIEETSSEQNITIWDEIINKYSPQFSTQQLAQLCRELNQKFGFVAGTLEAIATIESSFGQAQTLISSAGARGVMQLTKIGWADAIQYLNTDWNYEEDWQDWRKNTVAGAAYFNLCLNRYAPRIIKQFNLRDTLGVRYAIACACYNAGYGAIRRMSGKFSSTGDIMRYIKKFAELCPESGITEWTILYLTGKR